jgi:hypothetical protein
MLHAPVCELTSTVSMPSLEAAHLVPASTKRVIKQATWCPSKPGLLAGILSNDCNVLLWDALKPSQDVQVLLTVEAPSGIAWERFGTPAGTLFLSTPDDGSSPVGASTVTMPSHAAMAAVGTVAEPDVVFPLKDGNNLTWNRLIAVNHRRTAVEDVAVAPPIAFGVSARGDVAVSSGVTAKVTGLLRGPCINHCCKYVSTKLNFCLVQIASKSWQHLAVY